jgi:hypothetical protein
MPCSEVEPSGEGSSSCSTSACQVAEFSGGYEFVDTKLRVAGLGTGRDGTGRDTAVKSICSLSTIDCTQHCQIDLCLHRHANWIGAVQCNVRKEVNCTVAKDLKVFYLLLLLLLPVRFFPFKCWVAPARSGTFFSFSPALWLVARSSRFSSAASAYLLPILNLAFLFPAVPQLLFPIPRLSVFIQRS